MSGKLLYGFHFIFFVLAIMKEFIKNQFIMTILYKMQPLGCQNPINVIIIIIVIIVDKYDSTKLQLQVWPFLSHRYGV